MGQGERRRRRRGWGKGEGAYQAVLVRVFQYAPVLVAVVSVAGKPTLRSARFRRRVWFRKMAGVYVGNRC